MTLSVNNFINVCNFVAPYLQDKELKTLEDTYPITQAIAQKIFQTRKEQLEKLISSSYTCMKMYNVSSIKDMKIYILGEKHKEKYKPTIKAIIEHLASSGPVLVVLESLPSLKSLKKEELNQLNSYNHTISLIAEHLSDSENIYYTGWDDELSTEKIMQQKESIRKPFIEQYRNRGIVLDEKEAELQRLNEELNLAFENILQMGSATAILQEPQEFEGPHVYFEYLGEICNGDTIFDGKQELREKLEEFVILEEQLRDSLNNYNQLIREKKEFNLFAKKSLKEKDCEMSNVITETFPIRTAKSVSTLFHIYKYLEELNIPDATIVFVAGNNHVATPNGCLNDKNRNLDLFHDELKNHKAGTFIPTRDVKDYL